MAWRVLRDTQNTDYSLNGHARFATHVGCVSGTNLLRQTRFLSTLADARLFLRSAASIT